MWCDRSSFRCSARVANSKQANAGGFRGTGLRFRSTRVPCAFKNQRVRTCVIFNPAARGDKARRFLEQLESIGAEAKLKKTQSAGGARVLAREAVTEGFETIVAAGGDGTLNEVINGIGDEPKGFERARLGVLPLGTVNVFARELSLPRTFKAAWEVICGQNETRIDLPKVEFAGRNGKMEQRYFAQLAGAGLTPEP